MLRLTVLERSYAQLHSGLQHGRQAHRVEVQQAVAQHPGCFHVPRGTRSLHGHDISVSDRGACACLVAGLQRSLMSEKVTIRARLLPAVLRSADWLRQRTGL